MKTEPVAKFVFGRGNFWELYLDSMIVHTSAEMRRDEFYLRDIAKVVVRHNPDALKTRDVTLLLPDGSEIVADRVVDTWNLDKWLTAFGRYRPDLVGSPKGKRRTVRPQPAPEKGGDSVIPRATPSSLSDESSVADRSSSSPSGYDSAYFTAPFTQPPTPAPNSGSSYPAPAIPSSGASPGSDYPAPSFPSSGVSSYPSYLASDSQAAFTPPIASTKTGTGNEGSIPASPSSDPADRQGQSKLPPPPRPWVAGRFTDTPQQRFAGTGSASWESWTAASASRPTPIPTSLAPVPASDQLGWPESESAHYSDSGLPSGDDGALYTPPPLTTGYLWATRPRGATSEQAAWEPAQPAAFSSPDSQTGAGKETPGSDSTSVQTSDGVITSNIVQRFGPPLVTRATDPGPNPAVEAPTSPKLPKMFYTATPLIKRAVSPRPEDEHSASYEAPAPAPAPSASAPSARYASERHSSPTREPSNGAGYRVAPATSTTHEPSNRVGYPPTPTPSASTTHEPSHRVGYPPTPAPSTSPTTDSAESQRTDLASDRLSETPGDAQDESVRSGAPPPSPAGFKAQFTALFGEFDSRSLGTMLSAISSWPGAARRSGNKKPTGNNRPAQALSTDSRLESAREEFKRRAVKKAPHRSYASEALSKPTFPLVESSFRRGMASNLRQHSRLAIALGGLLLLVVVVAVLNATFGRSIIEQPRTVSATETVAAGSAGVVPLTPSEGTASSSSTAGTSTILSLPPVAVNTPTILSTPQPISTVGAQPTVSLSIIPTDTPQAGATSINEATATPATTSTTAPQATETPQPAPVQQPAPAQQPVIAPQPTSTPQPRPPLQPVAPVQPTPPPQPTATTQPAPVQPTTPPQPTATTQPAPAAPQPTSPPQPKPTPQPAPIQQPTTPPQPTAAPQPVTPRPSLPPHPTPHH